MSTSRLIFSRLSRSLSTTTPRHTSWQEQMPSIRKAMLSKPPKAIFDTLSPTPSHLLNISLWDYIPPPCFPSHFVPKPWDPHPQCELTLPSSTKTALNNAPLPVLPQGHHMVYFPPQIPPSELLPDGTDPDHLPGGPFVRRVWGGGSIQFMDGWQGALTLDGRRAVCVESIGNVNLRGSTPENEKIFVDVRRQYGVVRDDEPETDTVERVQRAPVIEERRNLVFMKEKTPAQAREDVARGDRIIKHPLTPDTSISLTPSPSLLFHFSALTFNAHAIHLDRQYTREIEGHRDLLVHGPLTLLLVFYGLRGELVKAGGEMIKKIEYRNLASLYAGEQLTVNVRRNTNGRETERDGNVTTGQKFDVWINGPRGGLAVKGVATTSRWLNRV